VLPRSAEDVLYEVGGIFSVPHPEVRDCQERCSSSDVPVLELRRPIDSALEMHHYAVHTCN
jgi:hypothetical protein